MKQITVLKAMVEMKEEQVQSFLDNDFRSAGEIVEAVCDGVERDYILFMYELIQRCDKLEKEEEEAKEPVAKVLITKGITKGKYSYMEDGDGVIPTDKTKKLFDWAENVPMRMHVNLSTVDFPNFIKRGDK